ncbi:hypothetical protein [Paenibacillus sp. CGMCC 1.18879]|uniref:hypothetical protein n=1 Tax=Paenibacillus sp. CGMCC 1.18879 TaxID=2834466 RepID=UPI001CA7F328|nr:hypothetical protein [Paenibacillus sp. CGMCC 1.18879]MBY9079528.1 hypothetical protein [Paenibacillus sp. CGMCC 1.18879]
MKYSPFIVIPVIALLIITITEYFKLFLFHKMLSSTYKKIKVYNISQYLHSTDHLLQRYKLVPKKNLELLKLKLESEDYNNTTISQIIDLLHKLVFSITTAAIAVIITISSANLSFLKDNKILQEDKAAWIKNVKDTLATFSDGVDFYSNLLFAALFIYAIFSLHFQIEGSKNKSKKKHLRFIEEALKQMDT